MSGFDNAGLYYADRFFEGGDEGSTESDRINEYKVAKATFKSFLREFQQSDTTEQAERFVYRWVIECN